MKDALGGSALLNLVIFFVSAIIILFISTLTYSKAYRVKNRIVEIIEKYGVYEHQNNGTIDDAIDEINPFLNASGYDSTNPTRCDEVREKLVQEKYDSGLLSENINSYGYNYCVFRVNNSVNLSGGYYVVVAFTQFKFPVIDRLLNVPVYSETKILGKVYDY